MYDFCITYPYSLFLAIGGIIGYIKKGSTASLAGGLGSAVILALLATISLKYFQAGKQCKIATFMSFLTSLGLSCMMWIRYNKSGKFFPSGLTLSISILMCIFYIWSITLGPKPHAAKQT